ncbi:glycosyltransferase family 4 protein [Flavobacterium sp. LaA7.5]|nr:glycosyltransferase family 4 protein [Flavobacterium salilacus subsp. altitudinum]
MAKPTTLYVFHKSGNNNHYIGLEKLMEQNNGKVVYREFSVVGKFFRSLFKLQFGLVGKQFVNVGFMLSLMLSKNKKVVLGIAPYDYKLTKLCSLLKNHRLYYHTSWTVWDGTYYPKKKRVTPKLIERWKQFIENDVKHIFAVSGETKKQLVANYAIPEEKVSNVYHSLDSTVFYSHQAKPVGENLKFFYAGRLVKQKGLEELLAYFSAHPDKVFTIAGEGELKGTVEDYAKQYSNINFAGYIKDRNRLADYYREHQYVVLNSYKTEKWEELFGMVLIEAMGCGAIPIATNHTGPEEIITDGWDGYLVAEGEMTILLNKLTTENYSPEMRQQAINRARQFYLNKIAERWKAVLL